MNGYYQNNKAEGEEKVVRVIYFPSFEEEVVIESNRGVFSCSTIEDIEQNFTKTAKPKDRAVWATANE